MKYLLICSLLLPSVLSTSFGSNSVVITSRDLLDGTTGLESLTPGEQYRVYAVVATYYADSQYYPYPSNIIIKGDSNDTTQFTITKLSKSKAGNRIDTGAFVLDENNILTAPITITDKNPKSPQYERVPFTLYIVSANYPAAPVVSAQLSKANSNIDVDLPTAPFFTILSAEPAFQLSNISANSVTSVEVRIAGYDVDSSYAVLYISESSLGSVLYVTGPIATVVDKTGNATYVNFAIKIRNEKDPIPSPPIANAVLLPGSSTAILSNGYLNATTSYNVDYINIESYSEIFYDFKRETLISFQSITGDIAEGEWLRIACWGCSGDCAKNVFGNIAEYDLAKTPNESATWCRRIYFDVHANTTKGPRFMVQIQSGAYATSVISIVIASIMAKLAQ